MKLMTQTFLIRGFEKSGAEVTMNLDCGRNNRTGPGIAIAVFVG